MNKTTMSNKERIREMTLLAMFIAIIAMLGLIPNPTIPMSSLGFVKIGPNIEATFIHIPVIIGAALMGRKNSILIGLAFGVIANIAAFVYASPFFVYPWVAILPRLVFGFIIYDFTMVFRKLIKNAYIAYAVSFLLLTLIHTLLVLTMLWTSFAIVMNQPLFESFGAYVTFLIAYNVPTAGLIEAGFAAVVGGTIFVRIARYYHSHGEEQEIEG